MDVLKRLRGWGCRRVDGRMERRPCEAYRKWFAGRAEEVCCADEVEHGISVGREGVAVSDSLYRGRMGRR